ncbi:winged helix-turn-helix domain-containing protein [Cellvibrio polysaccharolyticus]|jgi:DNA-binding MarR family transcriptional regulator|uniref:Transcriptional regulator n=1 Tax=Cellvibrio polysaccharolyticus TaxID=2082724 RepID=A0A928V623_9GAMM|nr:transcriptional regulator [Cellvibrio polysaccharolyticus]MBE8716749.1 transcriptional regulator [Cellvibrio polysaccharolyticus]
MSELFSLDSVDDVIHGRLRLGIMAYLLGSGDTDFAQLKAKTAATDGNLSVQLRKLEEAGYVEISKGFVGKKTVTGVTLTEQGRQAFIRYLDNMQNLINEATGTV